MTVTVNDLVLSVRRQAGDWGAALMTLDASMDASTTTLSVASRPDVVNVDQYVEVDLEEMEITEVSSDLTVVRASKELRLPRTHRGLWLSSNPASPISLS